jgi:uncharacterized membrane protein YfcA
MALLILVLTGVIAAQAHARSGNTSWKVGLQWGAMGIVGAYLGGRVAGWIPPAALLVLFALVIVASAAGMLRRRPPGASRRGRPMGSGRMALVGLALGFFTGMIGVGGGFLLVPALVLLCDVDVKKAVGTSLVIISINSAGGFLGFAAHTSFPLDLTATIAVLNALGSLVGQRLSRSVPSRRLRPAFAVFLLAVGATMIVRSLIDIAAGNGL